MNKNKNSNYDMVCVFLLLFSGLFFADALPVLIIGMVLTFYGFFKLYANR